MATEYKKTIFMGLNMPSDKCLLISIPMDMYRIQTNRFVSGLNYFQKAVLKLKYMPQISNEKIAALLHLEVHLVNIIVDELVEKGLLTSTGYITPDGEKARRDSSGLIIDKTNKQVGYVFSYNNGKELYPYYQSQVNFAEITGEDLVFTNDKVRTVKAPVGALNNHEKRKVAPSENEILQLIKHSTNQNLEIGGASDEEKGLFQIRHIPNEEPEEVNVCTYIYLPQIENDNTFADDWQVLDPFGNGNSYELKSYLSIEERKNKEFARAIFSTFKDVETESNRKFEESVRWFEGQVDERISILFGEDGFKKISPNVKQYIKIVVKSFMRLERAGFKENTHDQIQLFFSNMQKTIESILQQDQQDRAEIYLDLDNNYGEYAIKEDRQSCLREVFRKKIISDTTYPPKVLVIHKTKKWNGKSLLDYLMKFIMTISVEPNYSDCPIYGVFKNRIEPIVNIADMRNQMGHGSVESEDSIKSFSEEEIKKYFSFFKELLTDYINIL